MGSLSRNLAYIGKSNWSSDAYFKGVIDELVIYDYILTSNQRNCIYD